MRQTVALLGTLVVCAPIVRAEPPQFEHTPPTTVEEGGAVELAATIHAAGGLVDARAFWRTGAGPYQQVSLTKGAEDHYSATIRPPGEASSIEYFFSATDAKSLEEGRWKSREAPHLVTINRKAPPSIPPTPVVVADPPAAPAPVAAAPKAKPKLIVLEPQGERLEASILKLLDEVVLTEASRSQQFEVLGSSDVKRMLGVVGLQQQAGCDDMAERCLTEIGGALGAQFLLSTTLGRLGSKFLVHMKVIDVAHARVVDRRSDEVSADEDALGASVRRMLASLFPPENGAVASGGSSLPWIAIGAGGVAAAAWGAFLYAAIQANAAGDFDTAGTRTLGANVSLGTAGVALAAGLGLLAFGGD